MTNTLTNILPKILASGFNALRSRAMHPQLVNTDFSQDAATPGDTVNVPVAPPMAIESITAQATDQAPTAYNPINRAIALDQWKGNEPFHLTDQEMMNVDRDRHFVPMAASAAIEALAADVNSYVGGGFTTAAAAAVVDRSDLSGANADITGLVAAHSALNANKCPRGSRRGVVDYTLEAAMLSNSKFTDASASSDAGPIIEGMIGRKFGIDWFADDNTETHLTGAWGSAGDITVDGAHALGATTLAVTMGGTAADIHAGDVFSIDGFEGTYSATALATGSGNVTLSHPLTTALTGGEDLVFTGTASTTYTQSLVYHRDAYGLALRTLGTTANELGGGLAQVAVDPETSLALRLEVRRQQKQVAWQFDMLYGGLLVRPELACKLWHVA